jgi:uncharacterized protein (DUF362 family)/NAD-dependent dihydropyrimidine dehydrogenase PreA subunit
VTDRITIGDSPGGPFTPAYLKRVFEKAGFADLARETGVELNLDTSTVHVQVPHGKALKSITLSKAMVEADRLVNIAKFKTHMFLNISGATKNMFGSVPGANKFTYHSQFTRDSDFADLIVDVALASAPDLNIVDAVVGMDRNGPRAGELVEMKMLAAGPDAFAVDAVMMRAIGIELEKNKPLASAMRRGLLAGGELDLVGDDLETLRFSGFRLPDKKDVSEHVPEFIMRVYGNRMALRPHPVEGRCTGCKRCAEICPAKAIVVAEGLAMVDLKKCVRCYCCHELCEQDAIELDRPLLMRMMRMNRE